MVVFVIGNAVAIVVGVRSVADAVAVRVCVFVPVVGKCIAVVAEAVAISVRPLAGVERKGVYCISAPVVVVVRVDGVAQVVAVVVAGHVVGQQATVRRTIDRIEGSQIRSKEQNHLARVVRHVVPLPSEQHIRQTVAVDVPGRERGKESAKHTIADERPPLGCIQLTNGSAAVARCRHHC